jgi:hypothetical protein
MLDDFSKLVNVLWFHGVYIYWNWLELCVTHNHILQTIYIFLTIYACPQLFLKGLRLLLKYILTWKCINRDRQRCKPSSLSQEPYNAARQNHKQTIARSLSMLVTITTIPRSLYCFMINKDSNSTIALHVFRILVILWIAPDWASGGINI